MQVFYDRKRISVSEREREGTKTWEAAKAHQFADTREARAECVCWRWYSHRLLRCIFINAIPCQHQSCCQGWINIKTATYFTAQDFSMSTCYRDKKIRHRMWQIKLVLGSDWIKKDGLHVFHVLHWLIIKLTGRLSRCSSSQPVIPLRKSNHLTGQNMYNDPVIIKLQPHHPLL